MSLRIQSNGALGAGNAHIETEVNALAIRVTSGGIFVSNNGPLAITTIDPVTVSRVNATGGVSNVSNAASLAGVDA